MTIQVTGSEALAVELYAAFNGAAPSNPIFTTYVSIIDSTSAAALAQSIADGFASVSDATFSALVLDNLGVTAASTNADAFASLSEALPVLFAAYGPSARGQIVLNLVNILVTLESNETYGNAALAFNNAVGDAFDYASDTAHTSPGSFGSFVGSSFTLTTAANTFIGTSGDDTFTGAAGTLDGDVLIDESSTDNDTLNLTFNATDVALNAGAGPSATITKVENININLQVFNGGTFDATLVTGATITASSTKLGFDGAFSVTKAGANTVVAGTNITDLTVTDLTGGTVDVGAAETVVIDTGTTTASATVNVVVNGDVDLDVDFDTTTKAEVLSLEATSASVVTLATGFNWGTTPTSQTIAGTGDVTLETDGDFVDGVTVSGLALNVTGSTGGTIDATDFDVTSFEVSTADTLAISEADGQTIDLTEADADLTVSGSGATASVTVNVSADQAGGTTLTVDGVGSSTINLSADVAEVAALVIEGEATVNVVDDVVLVDVSQTAATDSLVIAGAGDVEVTLTDVQAVDASGLTGALTITTTDGADQSVVGGSGDNVVVLSNTTFDSAYVGGAGNDTVTVSATTGDTALDLTAGGDNEVTAAALTTGTLAVEGGAGDDTVVVTTTGAATLELDLQGGDDMLDLTGGVNAATTITVDFGTGVEDTLDVTGLDLSGTTLTLTGLEMIAAEGATFKAALLSGKAYTMSAGGAGTGFDVVGTASANTINLSTLTIDGTISTGADTIGIDGGAGADTITLVASGTNDTITVVDGETGITAATADSITNFKTGDDVISFDNGSAFTLGEYTEVSGLTMADFDAFVAAADAAFDGDGDDTDFYFAYDVADSGNGWLAIDADGDGATDNVIQLVGLATAASLAVTDLAVV